MNVVDMFPQTQILITASRAMWRLWVNVKQGKHQ